MTVSTDYTFEDVSRKDAIQIAWLVRIRWMALASLCIIFFGVDYILQLNLNRAAMSVILCLGALSNAVLVLLPRQAKELPPKVAGFALLLDVFLLTALLYLCGGYTNPFSMMFLGYVTLSASFLSARWTWAVFAVALGCFLGLFFFHVPVAQLGVHSYHGHVGGFSLHLHGMLIAFVVIGFMVASFVTRMNREIAEQARQIATLKRNQEERRRLLSLATLTAGAAHELATPIATLSLISDDLSATFSSDPRWREDVAIIQKELSRCANILRRMRGQNAELTGESPSRFTLGEIQQQLMEELDKPHLVSFSSNAVCNVTIYSLKQSLLASLHALIRNGLQACEDSGKVSCEMSVRATDVLFSVTDSGSGMSLEAQNRAGEPFFTSKEPGKGMGLGLYVTRLFAMQVGGSLDIASELGRGTQVCLRIPKEIIV